MRDRARFLAAFVKRPFDTGSVTPSSAQLAEAMVEGLGISEADTVVELGPGTGPFTRVIQEHLKPGACLMCFEINPDMAASLRRAFPKIHVVNDSIENLAQHLREAGRDGVDAVVSGLPWAAFSPDRQRRLLDATVAPMKPGARFATFAYSHAAWMTPARRFRELLDSRFSQVETSEVVWRNVPPAFVYRCRK
ncbi:MAG TPA: methyltransferase domain-containing protein [Vicinamibacteria bacterium]|nr:methyltransferase domain-containing protein [Vicinamibacteria bacterium]